MARKRRSSSQEQAQGVALIELVIAQVQANPRSIAGFCNDYPLLHPQPLAEEIIDTLRFPNGKELPPSLKRWLAFDYSWVASLGWFDASAPTSFTPRRVDEITLTEFGDPLGEMYGSLGERFDSCFLLPEGSDSRRIYAITEPDALGEYPVLVVDIDDLPYMGIMYPGFDVYLAELVDVLKLHRETYEDLFDDPRYAERLQWHADHLFHGKRGIECSDEEWAPDSYNSSL